MNVGRVESRTGLAKSTWFFFGVIQEALDKPARSHIVVANLLLMSTLFVGTVGIQHCNPSTHKNANTQKQIGALSFFNAHLNETIKS